MKRVLNLLVAIMLPLLAFSQWEVGADMGLVISRSNRSSDSRYATEPAATFLPELRGGYTFGSKSQWNVSMGASYFTKRYSLEPRQADIEATDDCRFHYFSLPVTLTYRIPVKQLWIGLSGGLQTDFYINQSTPSITLYGEESSPYELDNSEMNQGFEFSLGAELGYNINDNWKVLMAYRYAFDVAKVDDRNFHGKFRSNIISFGFRYVFSDVKQVESFYAVAEK